MTYAEVKTGDVIDGVKITDVEKDDLHLVFTFDIICGGPMCGEKLKGEVDV